MNSQFTAEEIRNGISEGAIQLFPKTNGVSECWKYFSEAKIDDKILFGWAVCKSCFTSILYSFDFSQVTYWVQGQGSFGSHGSKVNKSDPVSSLSSSLLELLWMNLNFKWELLEIPLAFKQMSGRWYHASLYYY